MAEMPSFIVL